MAETPPIVKVSVATKETTVAVGANTEATIQTNEILKKLDGTITDQMTAVVDAVSKPPPKAKKPKKDVEAEKEKKAESKGLRGMLKSMFGGAKKGKEASMKGIAAIAKMIDRYQKIAKGIVIAIGIGFIALLSQLKMSDLKKMWKSIKSALMAVWDFIVPIVKVIWEWGKNTLLPALVDYVVDQFNTIAELFTSIKERFAGFGAMSFKEKIFAVLGAFADIGEWVWDAVGNLLVLGEKLLGGDGSFIKNIWGTLKGFFAGIIDWLILLFTDPTKALDKMIMGFGEAIWDIGVWIWDKALKPLFKWLGKMWSDITKPIKDKWVELFPDGIGGFFVSKVLTPLKDYIMSLFDFSSIRTTIESLINFAYFIPNILKEYLIDPAVEWIGEQFGFDTKGFTDFNIGELAMKGFDIVVKFFEDLFDIKFPSMPDWDVVGSFKNLIRPLLEKASWIVPDSLMNWVGAKPKKKSTPPPPDTSEKQKQRDIIAAEQEKVKQSKAGKDMYGMFTSEKSGRKKSEQKIWEAQHEIALLEEQERIAFWKKSLDRGVVSTSETGGDRLAQLKTDEGFRASVYEDTEGIKTVGYGFNLERAGSQEALDASGINKSLADLKSGKESLTEEEASKLMGDEYGQYSAAARRFVNKGKEGTWQNLSQDRQRVITNMAYNIGEGSLNNFSKLRKALQAGDYAEAGAQMASSKWAGQVKGRATRLVARMTDNTSGTQLANLQTEGGNLQSSSGSGGAGNVTVIQGGDNTSTSHISMPPPPTRDGAVHEQV